MTPGPASQPPSPEPVSVEPAPEPRARSRVRLWGFRGLAILLGLAPFLLAEAGLRAFDAGRAVDFDDPFVGFSSVSPLFIPSADGQRYELAPARRLCFEDQSFALRKPPDEFRVFCLGGSTVQGRPFSVPTSFTTWLELSLRAADPDRSWRVVNCGGVSYASYRLLPVLREVLDDQPDLIILYIGDNEFLEERSYESLKRAPGLLRQVAEAATRSRLFNVVRGASLRLSGRDLGTSQPIRSILPAEVDALLDYKGGLERYHRDDAWREGVIAHFAEDLRRMVELCRFRQVPVILVNPVCNLETPPFKSEHRPGLTDKKRQAFDDAWSRARALYSRNLVRAVEQLRVARRIDGEHAGLLYVLGRALQDLGRLDEAREALSAARDWDVCPLRILSPMQDEVRRLARSTGVPFLDAYQLFADRSEGGIPGDAWLVDHVHPSIAGHQVLAGALMELMIREGLVEPRPGWQAERDRIWQTHRDGLSPFYYLQAEKRLQNLETWARGRVTRLREEGSIGEDFRRRHGSDRRR